MAKSCVHTATAHALAPLASEGQLIVEAHRATVLDLVCVLQVPGEIKSAQKEGCPLSKNTGRKTLC